VPYRGAARRQPPGYPRQAGALGDLVDREALTAAGVA
jgi:hypothetical protein